MVLTPGVCASSLAVMWRPTGARINHPRGDGGNSASLPEESTKDTVKTIRAGKAGMSRRHLSSTPCALLQHTRDFGCQPAPGLPCAFLIFRKARRLHSSGGRCRENTKARPLLRVTLMERSRASDAVIAGAATQSRIFPRRQSGLRRCARNDGGETHVNSASTTPSPSSSIRTLSPAFSHSVLTRLPVSTSCPACRPLPSAAR